MKKKDLEKFKDFLLKKKEQILNGVISKSKQDFHISTDDLADETDLANNVVNQDISFHIINREVAKIHLIDEALLRIQKGEYGLCHECSMPIGAKRLAHQPWATLCIKHAEEKERREHIHRGHRRILPF